MIVVTGLGVVIALIITGTLVLGVWPLCWEHLDRRGRTPSHSLLDYAVADLGVGLLISLIMGSVGSGGKSFLFPELRSDGA